MLVMERLYSIKVRASRKGKHLSGSERIVREKELEIKAEELFKRSCKKNPDFISVKIEPIQEKPLVVEKTIPIIDFKFKSVEEANKKAVDILFKETGIDKERLKELIEIIHSGAAPDRDNMRGAMIVNQNGERIELDQYRGVRTTTVDFLDRDTVVKKAISKGYTERTVDAVALVTKNMFHPDIIAEYCISDEPDYTTGYVANKKNYYRLFPLKEKGNPKGGRIYFVKNTTKIEDLYKFLQKKPVIIKDILL